MKRNSIILTALIAVTFTALIGFFALGLGKNPQELDAVRQGSRLGTGDGDINFTLPAFDDDREHTVADLPDGYFLLNVWGSWCPACHQEHPYLMQLGKIIPIIGLNWPADNPNEAHDAKRFLRELGNPYSLVLTDPQGSLIIDLGVYGAPETFLIAPNKTILYRYAGPMNEQIWQNNFLPLIKDLLPGYQKQKNADLAQ